MRCCLLVSVLALAPLVNLGCEPKPTTPQADTTALEKKVAELDRQLAELRKEVQDLRRQLQPKGEANAEKVAKVAWGKAINGLQAGLALGPTDKLSYQVGDTARFMVKVRNVSDRPIEMPYLAVEPGARVGPSVLDADGKRPPMSGPAYRSGGSRAISKLALAAGQEVEFAVSELIFGPIGEPKVQAKATVQNGPGKYQVSYHVYYLSADETGNSISTGEVAIEVAQSQEKTP
jgi:hypothetical protein